MKLEEVELADAKKRVALLKDDYDITIANEKVENSNLETAKIQFKRAETLKQNEVIALIDYDRIKNSAKSSVYAYDSSASAVRKADIEYNSFVEGVHILIARAKSNLDIAKRNLAQTTVYAPYDGYVTKLEL